jgi:hypothetical protein
MGWYDDEQGAGLPQWAVTPLMWIGCLMAAVLPAAGCLALWDAVAPDASAPAKVVTYLVFLGLMIAAIKPWSIR